MKLYLMKVALGFILLQGIFLNSYNAVYAEINKGDVVPINSGSAKVGSIAPELDLYDIDELAEHIRFKGFLTVMVSLNNFDDVDKLKQLQKL